MVIFSEVEAGTLVVEIGVGCLLVVIFGGVGVGMMVVATTIEKGVDGVLLVIFGNP